MKTLIWTAVLLGLVAGEVVADETLGPGTYTGWVAVDRWGGLFLCTRTRTHYVSKGLTARWLPFKNRFVTVEVTKTTHGPGMLSWRIDAVGKIAPVREADAVRMSLKLDVEKKTQQEHRDTVLLASLVHPGGRQANIRLTDIMLVILRKDAPGENTPYRKIHLKVSDGPSFLFDRPMSLRSAVGKHLYSTKKRYYAEELDVSSRGPLTWSLRLRHMFPPGEYEAWLIHRTDDADRGSKSASVAFEVVKAAAKAPTLQKPYKTLKKPTVHKSGDGGYQFVCDCSFVYRRADGTTETWLFEKDDRVRDHQPAHKRIKPYVDAYEKAGRRLRRPMSLAGYTGVSRKGDTVISTPVSHSFRTALIDQVFVEYWQARKWKR